jgi:hypothetical protein
MRPNPIGRLLLFSAVASVALLVAAAPALAGLVVLPDQYDFDEVQVGSTASANILISNAWSGNLRISSVVLTTGSSDFTPVNPPPSGTAIQPGSVYHMGVSFTPSAEGFVTAVLEVQWTNGESGTSTVALAGIGVTATPTPPTVEDVLAEFDERVANGALYGSGSGNSAEGRLGALRNMIAQGGTYLDQGEVALAVAQLEAVLALCDADFPPPDFVAGAAAAELHDMIEELIAALEG